MSNRTPLGEQGGRRAAGCRRGRGDQLGFSHLFGQRSDRVGGCLGGGLPRAGLLLTLRQFGQLNGQRGVPLHTIVDLGDGRRALLDVGIGGLEALMAAVHSPVGRPVGVK